MILVKFFWANRSFIMSNLSKTLTVAHLSWVSWAIHSRSLFWYVWPDWLAHSHSFVLSDLSESLTVAHLIWAIWANERMSNERMSEFPALLFSASGIPFPITVVVVVEFLQTKYFPPSYVLKFK